MQLFNGRIAALALVFALGATAAHAEMNCYGPEWQRVTEPRLGVSVEFSTDTYPGFGEREGYFAYSRDERMRPGPAISGRCSSFSYSMLDLRGGTISDTEAFFDNEQNGSFRGLTDGKLVSSRRLTVGGFPAREFTYSFTVDYVYTTATHRNLLVLRDDKLYAFRWVWGDGEGPPSDSQRTFNSIQFIPQQVDPNMPSRALLAMTLHEYWGHYPYQARDFFTPELKAIAEPKRAKESEIVKGYGHFEEPEFRGWQDGWRVFRIKHANAVVDWYIRDDGQKISGLTWKKVSP